MGAGIRRVVQAAWEGEGTPGVNALLELTAPLEALYGLAVRVRNAGYDRARRRAPPAIPVASVGGLTAGGSGKTPVIRWLADWLRTRERRPAIISRGYGADEVALYRRWFGRSSVFVARDRLRAVRAAGRSGCDVALVDDGFQHRKLARSVDLLLMPAEAPTRVRLLPRGPYREGLGAAKRATCILLTRRTAPPEAVLGWRERLSRIAPGVPILDVRLEMEGWSDLDGRPTPAPIGRVLAVCSVARPGAFRAGLLERLAGVDVELVPFADHHEFTASDVRHLLSRSGGRTIVTTWKDAVKLARFAPMSERTRVVDFAVAGPVPAALEACLEGIGLQEAPGC